MGATVLTRLASLRTAAIASDRGTFGTVVQLSSSGGSRFNINVDFRRIENREDDFSEPLPRASITPAFGISEIPGNFARSSYTQIGGVVSYSRANARFLGTAFYRDEQDHVEQYSIGPSVEWDVMRRGPVQVTLRSDLTMTERGTSGFAGVSLRLIGKRSAITAVAGNWTAGIANDAVGSGLVAGVTGAWNVDAMGGELSIGSGYEHQPLQDQLVMSTQFRHRLGTVTGDLLRNERNSQVKTHYALGLQTKIIAGAGLLRAAGGASSESLIVARVPSARDNDRFEVLINEQIGGVIKGRQALAFPLPAYRAYKVRIRPVGETLVTYDASIREVGLYPGSVASVEWTTTPVTIKLGQLLDADGQPVRRANISGNGIWSQTDENGFFQVEAADDAVVRLTLQDGREFELTLPVSGAAPVKVAQIGRSPAAGSRSKAKARLPRSTHR